MFCPTWFTKRRIQFIVPQCQNCVLRFIWILPPFICIKIKTMARLVLSTQWKRLKWKSNLSVAIFLKNAVVKRGEFNFGESQVYICQIPEIYEAWLNTIPLKVKLKLENILLLLLQPYVSIVYLSMIIMSSKFWKNEYYRFVWRASNTCFDQPK